MQWCSVQLESLIPCAETLKGLLHLRCTYTNLTCIKSQRLVASKFSLDHEQHWNSFFFSFHAGRVCFYLNLRVGVPCLTPALRSKSAVQLFHFECVFHALTQTCASRERNSICSWNHFMKHASLHSFRIYTKTGSLQHYLWQKGAVQRILKWYWCFPKVSWEQWHQNPVIQHQYKLA